MSKDKSLTELIYDEHCPGWDKTEGEELACTEYEDAARDFGKAASECANAIGFGDRLAGWLRDAPAGSLSPVFGIDLSAGDDIVYMVVVDYPCKPADPMERMVDGLTVRECLERYEKMQRERPLGAPGLLDYSTDRPFLTMAQRDAARLAWSAELKRKQQEAGEKERRSVVVDDDRWEP